MKGPSSTRREFEKHALPHLDELYAVALRYSRNPEDAKDLVQDAYLRAYAAWDRFESGSNCRAWLLTILTNGFINTYRKRRSVRKFAEKPLEETLRPLYGDEKRRLAENPETLYLDRSLCDEVSRALDALPDDHRVIVMLADLQGMKYRDVATRLRLPVGTVMSRLFRARRQLEAALARFARSEYGILREAA